MDDGIIVTNFEDRIVAINPAAQALTGWPADRLGGDLTLRSAPGEGTEVRVCIPLKSRFDEGDQTDEDPDR
ncbi:MAG: PAS domain-containing protein [Clostridia bacterium]|nr:PAS domain-containing protein [Clostridia bacterium]